MRIEDNISLKPYNTFGIDAQARRMVELERREEVELLPSVVEGEMLMMGCGSDIVFTRDYAGTVVRFATSGEVVEKDGLLWVPAGMVMDDFVQWAVEAGWYGAENLSGIPGTAGAGVVQNVGAYGVEAKDVVEAVEAYDLHERCYRHFDNGECRFGYRDSLFKRSVGRYVVLRVAFRLKRCYEPCLSYAALATMPHATAQQLRESVLAVRWSKLPKPEEYGSAGSFFKNPVVGEAEHERLKSEWPDMPDGHAVGAGSGTLYKLSAGWLIDRAGWKGRRMGRAGVWPQQALVLYNAGGCTGEEVVALAEAIQEDVERKFGVRLEPEAVMV